MISTRRAFFLASLFATAGNVPAEIWRTSKGEEFDGRLSSTHGPLAIFAVGGGSRQLAVEALDDSGVEHVADFIAQRPPPAPWKTSTSVLATALRGRLHALRNGKLTEIEIEGRQEPEIYLVFYGAGWNEGTGRFLPELGQRYRDLKATLGDRFEFIYVGRDRDGYGHSQFVREVAMPWPVVRFSALGEVKPVERWDAAGVPSLVALNPDGEVVLDSQRGNEGFYTPTEVLKQFVALLGLMSGESTAAKHALHRLTVVQHVRSLSKGTHAPRPYVIALDRERYQSVEVKRLIVTLELDERGRVTGTTLDPAQSVVIQEQFARDAAQWLFLPSVQDGKARRFTVRLPIEF